MNKWLLVGILVVSVEILVFGFPRVQTQPQTIIESAYYDSDEVGSIVNREIISMGYQGYPITSAVIGSVNYLDNLGDGVWSGSCSIYYKKPNGSAKVSVSWHFYEKWGTVEIDW